MHRSKNGERGECRISLVACKTREKNEDSPGLHKNLLRTIRRTRRRSRPHIRRQLLKGVIWPQIHPPKLPDGVKSLLMAGDVGLARNVQVVLVLGGRVVEEHGHVLRLAAARIDAVCIAGIRRRGGAGANVCRAQVALECRVRQVVVWGRVSGRGEVCAVRGGRRAMARVRGCKTLRPWESKPGPIYVIG